ncbi:MAG: CU044_5270 family protein [Brevundimonas sp.]
MNLDTLLDQTGSSVAPLSDTGLAKARNRLDAETRAAEARLGASLRTRRRRRVVISLTAVAAAAALVVAPTLNLGGHHATASASAAEVLSTASRAAATQPVVESGAYWHVVSEQQDGDGPAYHREIWLGRDATGVLQDARAAADQGDADLGPDGVRTEELGESYFGFGVTWAELDALPTDPAELETLIRTRTQGQGPDPDSELWDAVGTLLRETPARPALRAALWQVAARVPGVVNVGAVTDAEGRHGTAVALDIPGGRQQYVVDTTTGRLLEDTYRSTNDHSYRITFLSQGPADTAPTVDVPICGPGAKKSC